MGRLVHDDVRPLRLPLLPLPADAGQLLFAPASRRLHLPGDPRRRLRLFRTLRPHLDRAEPASVDRADVLPSVRGHRPPAQGLPGPVRLCQVVEAEPDVAQRDLLVERLGHGHGQYAPGSGGVQSDLLQRPHGVARRQFATDARQRVAAPNRILHRTLAGDRRGRGRKPLPQKAYQRLHVERRGGLPLRPLRRRVAGYGQRHLRLLGVADRRSRQGASGPFRGSLERLDGVRSSAPRAVALGRPPQIQRSGPLLAGRRLARGQLYGDRRPLAQGLPRRGAADRREPLRRGLRGVEEYGDLLGVLRSGEARTRIHGPQGFRRVDRTAAHRRLHRVHPRHQVRLFGAADRVGPHPDRGARHRTLSVRSRRRRGPEGPRPQIG